jgi:uncharacterized protein YndB with AHSA1/START domain
MSDTANSRYGVDPERDLVLERTVPVPPERVWAAWTQPHLLKQWFCPVPYTLVECEIDLQPGGRFFTVMESPEGERMAPGNGCYLEVLRNRRLVWTSALGPGFRPNPPGAGFVITAVISMEPAEGGGCRYTAHAIHADPASAAQHADMGFHAGWGAALDQLVSLMR